MTLSTFDQVAAITEHSAGFAAACRDHLDAPVQHCPGWSVADLVRHLTEVHWLWGTIVEERLTAPPEESRRPPRAAEADLVDVFVAGAARLVQVLREADQSAHCWTWAGWQQDVAFVTRHQVQEAVVHHWDAALATGAGWALEPAVAADAVDEFLHFSVASEDDPDEPTTPPLDGTFALRTTDTGDAWTLTDGARPGVARVVREAADVPTIEATATELLLWLYERVDLDTGSAGLPDELVARFRAITFTD
jgi:uncharacterized protein (TIGR03083 family)